MAAAAIAVGLSAGCTGTDPSPTETTPALPTAETSETEAEIVAVVDQTQVLLQVPESGTLALVGDRCIGLALSTGELLLGLFSSDTTVSTDGNRIIVTLPDGSAAAVGDAVNTVGATFSGDDLARAVPDDIPAECVTEGAIQVGEMDPA